MKVIWFSEIKWNFLTHRHHHLIRHFPETWEILFIESFVLGKENHFRPRRDGRVVYATVPIFKGTEYKAINALQNNSLFRGMVSVLLRLWIKLLLTQTGFSDSGKIILTSNIYFADIIRRLKRKLLIYDCNDYPMGFSGGLPMAETYFRKSVECADIAIAVSNRLLEDIGRYKKGNGYVIGNGVDYDLFAHAMGSPAPSDIEKIKKPIALYCGVISDWFDFELLETAARKLPDVSFVIIGPSLSEKSEKELKQASRCPNVFLLGLKEHSELPRYIRESHVCIIPFKKNALIERFSPNKMYEYLAVGKPVVTLDYTEEIKGLKRDIYVAESKGEFVEMIGKAAAATHDPERLKRLAQSNSWKNKSQQMVDLIANYKTE